MRPSISHRAWHNGKRYFMLTGLEVIKEFPEGSGVVVPSLEDINPLSFYVFRNDSDTVTYMGTDDMPPECANFADDLSWVIAELNRLALMNAGVVA